ncbi:hypothetical protein L6452_38781 [Arctium lappa]|uniref:Uncharacterized protein n=1 Tax=Arctium lappa TaxID=4217 RepID=A0ACB8XR15_ARCLA|nr:hypothetical protein L6452_38781 [Arctium lappa]
MPSAIFSLPLLWSLSSSSLLRFLYAFSCLHLSATSSSVPQFEFSPIPPPLSSIFLPPLFFWLGILPFSISPPLAFFLISPLPLFFNLSSSSSSHLTPHPLFFFSLFFAHLPLVVFSLPLPFFAFLPLVSNEWPPPFSFVLPRVCAKIPLSFFEGRPRLVVAPNLDLRPRWVCALWKLIKITGDVRHHGVVVHRRWFDGGGLPAGRTSRREEVGCGSLCSSHDMWVCLVMEMRSGKDKDELLFYKR